MREYFFAINDGGDRNRRGEGHRRNHRVCNNDSLIRDSGESEGNRDWKDCCGRKNDDIEYHCDC